MKKRKNRHTKWNEGLMAEKFRTLRNLTDGIVQLCRAVSLPVFDQRLQQLHQLYDFWVNEREVIVTAIDNPADRCQDSVADNEMKLNSASVMQAKHKSLTLPDCIVLLDRIKCVVPMVESLNNTQDNASPLVELERDVELKTGRPAVVQNIADVEPKCCESAASCRLEETDGTPLADDALTDIRMAITLPDKEAKLLLLSTDDTDLEEWMKNAQGNTSPFVELERDLELKPDRPSSAKNVDDLELACCESGTSCRLEETKGISLTDDASTAAASRAITEKEATVPQLFYADDAHLEENLIIVDITEPGTVQEADVLFSKSRLQNDASVCSGCDLTLTNDGINNCNDRVNAECNEEQVELTHCGSIAICKSESVQQIEIVPETADDPSTASPNNVLSPEIIGKRFKCHHCSKEYLSYDDLVTHMRAHTGEDRVKCSYCDRSFADSSSLWHHVQHFHKNLPNPFACKFCGKTFWKKRNFDIHVRLHTSDRPFRCELCDKSYPSKGSLKTHVDIVHKRLRPFMCDYCHKRFAQSAKLTNHLRTHTGERPFLCKHCGKPFNCKSTLARHTRIHGRRKVRKCNRCAQEFPDQVKLYEHRLETLHDIERSIQCKHCSKTLISKDAMRTHEATFHHTGPRVAYVCQVCGKSCPSPSALEIHARKHTGERPFQCKACVKAFDTAEHRNRHALTHSGVKPYKCSQCDKTFTQSYSLVQHLRIHNNVRPHKCHLCDWAFHQSYALVKHLKTHAENPKK